MKHSQHCTPTTFPTTAEVIVSVAQVWDALAEDRAGPAPRPTFHKAKMFYLSSLSLLACNRPSSISAPKDRMHCLRAGAAKPSARFDFTVAYKGLSSEEQESREGRERQVNGITFCIQSLGQEGGEPGGACARSTASDASV